MRAPSGVDHDEQVQMYKFVNMNIYVGITDITALKAEAIVNAANGLLQYKAGLALDISRAAGPDLHTEGQNIIRRNGVVSTCGNVVTTGGNQPCHSVIHVVEPEEKITEIMNTVYKPYR